ncbi:MAG: HAD hydrolase-like protein, partial [Streptococcus mitis]|nr:HAD hydrolase-like protein [Streptococcus mitis]
YKSTLFPQIVEALEALHDENIPLYVTTSKHEPVALQMCQDLGIAKYFKGIYGSNSDRIHKADVIRYALSSNDLPKEETVIIGDTKFDLIGGQAVGIKTMAVTWGFGEQADLLNYHPNFIAHKPIEVLEYFQ